MDIERNYIDIDKDYCNNCPLVSTIVGKNSEIHRLETKLKEAKDNEYSANSSISDLLDEMEKKDKEIKLSNQVIDKRNNENLTLIKMCIKKDKIIDMMAEQLAGLAIFDMDIENPLILGDKEEVKKYFEEKVEK